MNLIKDEKEIEEIEKHCAVADAAQVKNDVYFIHRAHFFTIKTGIFTKKGADWYGVYIIGTLLLPSKVEWKAGKIFVDCESEVGKKFRFILFF